MKKTNNLSKIAAYYDSKIAQFGAVPKGVDWNGTESQLIRFEQLAKIINSNSDFFSISDLGCGYGAFNQFLIDSLHLNFEFHGYDVSEKMIAIANSFNGHKKNIFFTNASLIQRPTDYVVASGIFNVKLDEGDKRWSDYIIDTINHMNANALKSFSFNCLTKYSDKDKMKDYLYYADPCAIFDYCKKHFSRNVALIHDYELYEFTIAVKKYG